MNKIPFNHSDHQIYWVLTDACNYRCRYCFTQGKGINNADSRVIADNFSKKIEEHKGKWDFVISGGEPFNHKIFLDVIKILIKTKQIRRISVYTNFSAKLEHILKFLKITEKHRGIFYASLHLDHVNPADFLNKICQVEKKFPGFKKNLFVHSVGTIKDLPAMKKIKKMFYDSGIQFFALAHLLPDLKCIRYTAKQKGLLEQISRIYNLPRFYDYSIARCNYGVNISSINFLGKKCSAGCKSFFVSPLGDIYPCLAASRAKKDYLGNIVASKNFKPKKNNKCQFTQCVLPADYEQYFWPMNKRNTKKPKN